MLNQPMGNLQISGSQDKPPQSSAPGVTPGTGMPGVRPGQPSMAPPQGPMLGNSRTAQQLPPHQFAPRMATGLPPSTGTLAQPPFPGPRAPSQRLPNGKVTSI